jgi:hypothetical protein
MPSFMEGSASIFECPHGVVFNFRHPEIGEKGCGGRRNVLGGAVGCGPYTLLDLSGPVACERNLRRVRCRVISLRADAR